MSSSHCHCIPFPGAEEAGNVRRRIGLTVPGKFEKREMSFFDISCATWGANYYHYFPDVDNLIHGKV